jgi:TonB family protein
MISPGLNIEVGVTIDVDGNVSNAKLVSTNGAGVRLIENEVLQAARLFRFRPAQDNHGNVESQMVLTFHFTGGPAK